MTSTATDTLAAAPGGPLPRTGGCGVLVVGNFLSASGGSRGVCEDLALRLPEAGFSVTTTSSRRARSWRLLDMMRTTWRARGSYEVAQIDVFSGTAFVWAELTAALLTRLGTPYVLTLHGGNLPRFSSRWPSRTRRLLRGAAAVTTPSPFLQRSMSHLCKDLVLVPNPIEVGRYEYRPRSQPNPHLVWLRAFHHVYNPALAVRCLALLAEVHPDARLTMLGPDKDDGTRAQALTEAERLGVLARLTTPGPVPKSEVPRALQEGDLFLNTSRVDNAPVSILEPMACGIPVVSTDVGGIPDLVSDGEDAVLVPSDDAAAMTQALGSLIEQPGRAAALVERGRRRAEAHDWSRVLPLWREILGRAAKGTV